MVRALDADSDVSMHPTAALWFLFPDEDTWRLLLALPAMAVDPPQAVYTRFLNILSHRVQAFSFDSVGLMPPDNAIVDLLGAAIQTPPDAIAGIRFTNNTINGQLIPDAYIYRLTRPVPERAAAG